MITTTREDYDAAFERCVEEAGRPTIGRIVHYMTKPPSWAAELGHPLPEVTRAAIITEVGSVAWFGEEGREALGVALNIFHPHGAEVQQSVPFSPTPKPGHWSWPPRT